MMNVVVFVLMIELVSVYVITFIGRSAFAVGILKGLLHHSLRLVRWW